MEREEFSYLIEKLRPWTDYLYFHIMGEPLCHPNVEEFLSLAGNAGFKVIITTNGTLLEEGGERLLEAGGLHKINISLHAFEANNMTMPFDKYLEGCFSFGRQAEGRKIVVYRLWNGGGADRQNGYIKKCLEEYFPGTWKREPRGMVIGNRVFLKYGDKFDWPDLSATDTGKKVSCYGLRDQIGVLCDGTVVPCCLDHDGDIPLGNLFEEDMEDILNSKRARDIYDGFMSGEGREELCRRCGFAKMRFGK